MARKKMNIAQIGMDLAGGIGGTIATDKVVNMIPFGSEMIKNAGVALIAALAKHKTNPKNTLITSALAAASYTAGSNAIVAAGLFGLPDPVLAGSWEMEEDYSEMDGYNPGSESF